MPDLSEITLLLRDVEAGRDGAMDALMRAVYSDLERMAASHLRRQFGAQAGTITLEPAALVNESFMKLIRQRTKYDNRGHFFAIATKMMIRVLLDYRRQRNAQKRGGPDTQMTLALESKRDPVTKGAITRQIELEALASALDEMEALDPRKADVVKLRIVWGLSNDEIAEALGISRPTVERDWRFAKAWLAESVGLQTPAPQPARDLAPDALTGAD